MQNLKIQLPEKLKFFLTDKSRYKVAYGGRGAGKSESIARCLIALSLSRKLRILCTRELQNSITDSVHKLLSDLISDLKLDDYFTITQHSIRNIYGSEFLFKGLKNNINEIKSLQGIDYVWVEEAERVSENSWQILIPTVRQEGSEIWVIFNPESPDSATYDRFILKPPPSCKSVKINYYDNPWFPAVLKSEMEYDKKVNPEKYDHVWEGNPRSISDAQIFKGKWEIQDFQTPPIETMLEQRFFYGLDWGFNPDPLAGIRCFIVGDNLYIDQEVYKVGVELKNIGAEILTKMPEVKKWPSYGDSARPDIISMLRTEGFNISGVKKSIDGGQSNKLKYVESGVDYIKNFNRIIIHPSCKNAIDEFRLYSYKVDNNTGEILPIILDKYNHIIDSLRYALSTYITPKEDIFGFAF